MLDQETFEKIKKLCLAKLDSLALKPFTKIFLFSQINRAQNIHDLLSDFIIHPEGTTEILQHACNLLTSYHLESLMGHKHADCNYPATTLRDWNRSDGCHWRVNGHQFYQAGSIMQYQSHLQMYGITDLKLRALISDFANQTCWLEPIKIIKAGYLTQNWMIGNSVKSTSENDWDSVDIFSLVNNRLKVTLVCRFPQLINLSIGNVSLLNPPMSLTVNFEIDGSTSIVDNFSINAENLPDDLISPTVAIANYFIEQEQSTGAPPRSHTPPPLSPHKQFMLSTQQSPRTPRKMMPAVSMQSLYLTPQAGSQSTSPGGAQSPAQSPFSAGRHRRKFSG